MNKQLIKKKSRTGVLIRMVKLIILLVVASFIYYKIQDPQKFGDEFYGHLKRLLASNNALFLTGIVILLMPLNWFLEAVKWKKLVSARQKISIGEAFKGVVTGLSLGFATPHAIGDYAGRIVRLKGGEKTKFIGSVWLGNIAQMSVTATFGVLGLVVYYDNSDFEFPTIKFILILVFIVIVGTAIFFFLKKRRQGWLRVIQFYFNIILTYSLYDLVIILGVAMLRYVVFSLQFMLILISLEIQMPTYQMYAGISWVFLFKSIIPSFNFMSDLGVRELSALAFFDLFEVNQSAVVAGSLLLWIINILIPVILGLYFVFHTKISKSL